MRKKLSSFYISHPILTRNFVALLFFMLVDAVWLRSLPYLGISYGPARLPFFLFSTIRVGLFLVWSVGQGWLPRARMLPANLSFYSFLTINLAVLMFGIDSFCIEPFQLTQSNIQVPVPGLSRPIRIVQLSDIHIEYTTRREQALPGFVEQLHPDMIVMTGDYTSEAFTNDPVTFKDLRKLVAQLQAPLGVYAVNGNAEEVYVMDLLFAGTGVHLLENQVERIPALGDHVAILGLSYIDDAVDGGNLARLMAQVRPDEFTILLYHKPDLAYEARDLNIDLYLCGHTHGGQVRLPIFGALYTNSKYGKTFEMGRYTLGRTTLFVSRGLGFTGGPAPRMRFGTPPEVVVIDLVPSPEPAGQ